MDEQISPETQTAGKPTAPEPSRARPASRKHMGVATSDPTYLPPVNNPNAPQRDRNVRVPVRKTTYGSGGFAQTGGVARRPGGYIPPSSPTLQVRANEAAATSRLAGAIFLSKRAARYSPLAKIGSVAASRSCSRFSLSQRWRSRLFWFLPCANRAAPI